MIIGMMTIGLRAISSLQIFKSFAMIIEMLQQSIYDMIPFIILVYSIVLLFSFFENILDPGHDNKKNRAFLYEFGKSYGILFGENPDQSAMSNLDWIYYFSLTTLLNIVAFNLLISLISNTFDRVLSSLPSIQCKIKAELLCELASFWPRKVTEEKYLKYLFVVRYTSDTIGAIQNSDMC